MAFSEYQTDDGTKSYTLRREIEIEKRQGLYIAGGISAGAMSIGGVPVALDDGQSLHVAAKEIRHSPNKYKLGQIELSM